MKSSTAVHKPRWINRSNKAKVFGSPESKNKWRTPATIKATKGMDYLASYFPGVGETAETAEFCFERAGGNLAP